MSGRWLTSDDAILIEFAFQVGEQPYFVLEPDRREEGEAAPVGMRLHLAPRRGRHRAALEDVVERLGHALGRAGRAVGKDLVGERRGAVGHEPVGIEDLELDRVRAGIGREVDKALRRIEPVMGRAGLERDEAGLAVADQPVSETNHVSRSPWPR